MSKFMSLQTHLHQWPFAIMQPIINMYFPLPTPVKYVDRADIYDFHWRSSVYVSWQGSTKTKNNLDFDGQKSSSRRTAPHNISEISKWTQVGHPSKDDRVWFMHTNPIHFHITFSIRITLLVKTPIQMMCPQAHCSLVNKVALTSLMFAVVYSERVGRVGFRSETLRCDVDEGHNPSLSGVGIHSVCVFIRLGLNACVVFWHLILEVDFSAAFWLTAIVCVLEDKWAKPIVSHARMGDWFRWTQTHICLTREFNDEIWLSPEALFRVASKIG